MTRYAPRRHPRHVFHLIMTIITLGLWAPIWLLVTVGYVVGRAEDSAIDTWHEHRAARLDLATSWAQWEQLPNAHNALLDSYYTTQPVYVNGQPQESYR